MREVETFQPLASPPNFGRTVHTTPTPKARPCIPTRPSSRDATPTWVPGGPPDPCWGSAIVHHRPLFFVLVPSFTRMDQPTNLPAYQATYQRLPRTQAPA